MGDAGKYPKGAMTLKDPKGAMTIERLRQICREHKDMYSSPELNSKLLLQYEGFQEIKVA